MKHTTSHQYDVRVREDTPKLQKTKVGTELLCPFCEMPHPLWPGEVSSCGTTVKVTAIQTVIPEKRAKKDKILCLKCKKSVGGDMVQFMTGFIHLLDCDPTTKLIASLPEFSNLAKFTFGFKENSPIRKMIEKRYGKAKVVSEIDASGNDTGKIRGYFFHKGK
jgi:hypothetical protein